jgi:hypothetical protein
MRTIIALIVIVYVVGIGVELSPTVREKWTKVSTSDFVVSIVRALPAAMAWPATVYRSRFASY